MIFEQISAGGDRNFAYLVGDEAEGQAAAVDPGGKPGALLVRARAHGLEVIYLINTHGHPDHAAGNKTILSRTGAKLVAGNDAKVAEGTTYSLGSVTLTVLHTPGHTEDSICVLVKAPGEPGKLLTGDTLFVGKVGGTGYGDDARAEYDSLHEKLLRLPDDIEVWPGHDYGVTPSSTIGREKKTNPFLLCESFEAFVKLKRNWLRYKAEHGIK